MILSVSRFSVPSDKSAGYGSHADDDHFDSSLSHFLVAQCVLYNTCVLSHSITDRFYLICNRIMTYENRYENGFSIQQNVVCARPLSCPPNSTPPELLSIYGMKQQIWRVKTHKLMNVSVMQANIFKHFQYTYFSVLEE